MILRMSNLTSARVSYACFESSGLTAFPCTVGDTCHPQLSWRHFDMEWQSHDMELRGFLTFRFDT